MHFCDKIVIVFYPRLLKRKLPYHACRSCRYNLILRDRETEAALNEEFVTPVLGE